MSNKLFFLLCICVIGNSLETDHIQPKHSEKNQENKLNKPEEPQAVANISSSVKKDDIHSHTSNNASSNAQNIPQGSENVNNPKDSSEEIESGTVIRGILVFVGISFIFIIYLGCKTYRKKKMPIIKKYGVRGRRSDVEMRPLPLDDDDEDETVFDVGSLNKL